MLPQYIPLHVAESILFVGKAIRILRNPSKSFKSHLRSHDQQYMKQETMSQEMLIPDSELKESFSELLDHQGSELLPQSEIEKIASLIETLKVLLSFIILVRGDRYTFRFYFSACQFSFIQLLKNILKTLFQKR